MVTTTQRLIYFTLQRARIAVGEEMYIHHIRQMQIFAIKQLFWKFIINGEYPMSLPINVLSYSASSYFVVSCLWLQLKFFNRTFI